MSYILHAKSLAAQKMFQNRAISKCTSHAGIFIFGPSRCQSVTSPSSLELAIFAMS